MSYDYSAGAESKQTFLLRILGLDANAILEETIQVQMDFLGIRITAEKPIKKAEDCDYTEVPLDRIEFSDGRIFEHRCTEVSSGDNWGCDSYEFVEMGKPYELHTVDYAWEDGGERRIESSQTFLPITEETPNPNTGEHNEE